MPGRRATVFALASGPGKSGVAVFRISGPNAFSAARALAGAPPAPRRASLRLLREPGGGPPIDEGLVLLHPAPGSFTGEDVAELQVHGSPAVARRLLAVLADLPGLRLAEPGEFTRRAFENGRLDLPQVEGLADLIDAETEAQRRLALRSMRGEASERALEWRRRLVQPLALAEAVVDFPEEVDEGALRDGTYRREVRAVADEIRSELRGSGATERLRSGLEVAVIGPPNAGKSRLVNRLAGRELAISTAEPGTTRDVIEAHLEVRGLPVTVLDTAGLRAPMNPVEAVGIERAERRARLADLRLHMASPDSPAPSARSGPLWAEGDIAVWNKCDLAPPPAGSGMLAVSAARGDGVRGLVDAIGDRLAWVDAAASPVAAGLRRRTALEACVRELESAESAGLDGDAPEIGAEHLRRALAALERFAGRTDVEEVLDIVFAQFCLGK